MTHSLSKSVAKMAGVILLNPNFSSMTNVLYMPNGMEISSLAKNIMPKNIKATRIVLSVKPLAISSTKLNPKRKNMANVTRVPNTLVILLNFWLT